MGDPRTNSRKLLAMVAGLLGLLSVACVHTKSVDQSWVQSADCECERYDSVEEAVRNAAESYLSSSVREDLEYMGGVLRLSSDGTFVYSVGKGKKGQDKVSVRIVVPQGSELVALWHTHGAGDWSRSYFSEIDTGLVESTGLPLYLADPAGTIHVYAPGDPTLTALQSRRMGLGRSSGYAKGRLVPKREPIDSLVM